jgi:hypothetical protein
MQCNAKRFNQQGSISQKHQCRVHSHFLSFRLHPCEELQSKFKPNISSLDADRWADLYSVHDETPHPSSHLASRMFGASFRLGDGGRFFSDLVAEILHSASLSRARFQLAGIGDDKGLKKRESLHDLSFH